MGNEEILKQIRQKNCEESEYLEIEKLLEERSYIGWELSDPGGLEVARAMGKEPLYHDAEWTAKELENTIKLNKMLDKYGIQLDRLRSSFIQ